MAAILDDQVPQRTVTDRDGRVYSSQAEKMKYFMRRVRGSLLPHYPEREPKNGGT